jgi:hypothetical protein
VATTNSTPFLGCDEGECLYAGADGQYKDGDEVPWTVTGKWKYGRNRTLGEIDPETGVDPLVVGEISIPDVRGHEYVEVHYHEKEETVTHNGAALAVLIQYPRWVYVHTTYFPKDHNDLGFL